MGNRQLVRLFWVIFIWFDLALTAQSEPPTQNAKLLSGKAAMGDWTTDAPGVRRKITIEDLPAPSSTFLALNFPRIVGRPVDAHFMCHWDLKLTCTRAAFAIRA